MRATVPLSRLARCALLVLTVGSLGASCSGDGEPATIDRVEPTSLRSFDGPWPDAEGQPARSNFFDSFLASLGTNEVLAATWVPGEQAQFVVGDLDAETWSEVDGIPGVDDLSFLTWASPETGHLGVVTVNGDVYLSGGRCPAFNLAVEEEPVCRDPGDFEVWRFTADGHEWEKVLSRSFDDLTGSSEWFSTRVLGVVDDRIIAVLYPYQIQTAPIVALDISNGTVEEIGNVVTLETDSVDPLCVTGDGTVAGIGPGKRLATLQPDQEWVVHEDLVADASRGLDRLICGADTIVLLVEDLDGGVLRSIEVTPSGEVIDEMVLPDVLSFAAHLPGCDTDPGSPVPQESFHLDGAIGFARGFGEIALEQMITGTEGVPCEADPDDKRQIIVQPGLDAQPLIEDYQTEGQPVALRDATLMPDGRIAMLIDKREYQGGDPGAGRSYQGHTELLVAE